MPEVREGMLRGNRTTTNVEGQDTRVAMGRSPHMQRGAFVNYYKDLGVSTTAENAKVVREQEAAYRQNVAEQQGKVNTAKDQLEGQYDQAAEQINKAEDSIPGFNEAIKKSWNDTQSGFTKINVVRQDGKGGYIIENSYRLPKQVAEDMAKTKGVYTNWGEDGQFYVDVKVKGGRYIGQELHEAFGQGEKDVYNKWYINSAPQIKKSILTGQSQIAEAKNQLETNYNTAAGQIAGAQSNIDSATKKHDMDWQKIRDDYIKRKDMISQIFGNMQVKEAGK